MDFRSLDQDYAVTGQLQPSEIPAVAAAGFKSIVCARPDREDNGQPSFCDVAREAERAGLMIVHVPVSGALSQGAFVKFEQAMQTMPRPVLGYCRSGGRAASLYSLLKRA
jgi:uncharacterized protein (TIGR01244 family)